MKTYRYLLIFLLPVCLSAAGQKQNIRFEHLGINQGLSQSNVLCILQDSRGFMWFGTRDGLNKYDGYKFTVYKNDARNPRSLCNNFIQDIIESKNGDIWIATKGGICRYDYQKNQFTSFKHDQKSSYSLSTDLTSSILEDSGGNIWVGTEDGLNMLDLNKNRFLRYTYNSNDTNSLSDVYVRNIFEDSKKNLWVCTFNGGLNLFNRETGKFSRFQHKEEDSKSIGHNNVYTIFEDSRHLLWVGTVGGGLELFDKTSREFRHFKYDAAKNTVAGNSVYAINEDDENNLWIGTENGGLSIFDPRTELFQTYKNDEIDYASLSNNSIYAVYKDTKSNMWLGTFNGGVDLVNPDGAKFAHYKHFLFKNSLSNNNVLCIIEDRKKNIWIGTDGGGLNLFDPLTGNFTHYRHEKNNIKSICGDYVLGVCEDSKGNLWIGTWGDGVTVFNKEKNTFRHFKNDPLDPSSLSGNNAWKIFEDSEKKIWIGAFGSGLNLFNPATNSFTRYQFNEQNKAGLSNNNIYSVFEDSEKKLWVSTDGGGLNLFDRSTGTFSCLLHDEKKNSISSNSTGSICEDRNKNLWIGTMDGLSFLDKKTKRFNNYTIADGLPNNVIFGILEDGKGNLWISTNKGISRFDPVTKVFKNFGVSDGLQSNEFKIQAFCKSSDGTMYFGGNNGFNKFFPDSVKDHFFEPPLMITGFQVFNKEVPVADDSTTSSPLKKDITATKDIVLSYKSSVISFEFASLNYTSPEKKKYAYMLEGFDKNWNEVGTQRTATYTNLDPAEYFFKVKGLNNDGSWSSSVTTIKLTITPPFWKTWWFRIILGTVIIGLVIALHRIRMRAVNKQKEALEKQVAVLDAAVAKGKFEVASDVMHDIGNAVVGFGSYMTRIKRLQQQDNPENLQNLTGFFKANKPAMATAIGEDKAGAVVEMLDNITETQKNHQQEIRNSITEQIHIISNIQEILNIQRQYINGRQTEQRKPVNLQTVTNDCISILLALIDKMSIAVTLDFTTKNPVIKGDRTKLTQLLLNVLKNSLDAFDINSSERNISVSIYNETDCLVLQVKDSGNGFGKTVADQLFKRGFTTKLSGTGQSLYNCRAIAESHDGTITVTSEGPGTGAVTTIKFKT